MAPLQHSRFRLLAGGQLASNLGDAFYAVALPWYVLEAHRGAVLLGTVLASYGIARVGTLVAGGWASDRWRPWTVMLVADSARALLVAALALVAGTSRPTAWELVPIGLIIGAGEGLSLPASSAVVPRLLPDQLLEAGNSLLTGGAQLSSLVGPAIGGVVVALLGPPAAFGVDAASFSVSAASLALVMVCGRRAGGPIAPTPTAGASAPDGGGAGAGHSLWQLLRRERLLQLLFLIPLIANLGAGAAFDVALPALARGPFSVGSSGYGALLGCEAAGGLTGVLVAGRLRPGRRPAIRVAGVFIGAAASLAAVPYVGGAIGAGASLATSAALLAVGNVALVALVQRWAPPAMLGRVVSIILLGGLGSFPVSVAAGGVIVQDLGPAPVFLSAAVAVALAVACALTQAEFRCFGGPARRVEADGRKTV